MRCLYICGLFLDNIQFVLVKVNFCSDKRPFDNGMKWTELHQVRKSDCFFTVFELFVYFIFILFVNEYTEYVEV